MNLLDKLASLIDPSKSKSQPLLPLLAPQPPHQLPLLLHLLLESTPEWELWLTPQLHLLATNSRCLPFSGYSQVELLSDPTSFLRLLPPDQKDLLLLSFQKKTQPAPEFQLLLQPKNQPPAPFLVRTLPLSKPNHPPIAFRLLLRPPSPTPSTPSTTPLHHPSPISPETSLFRLREAERIAQLGHWIVEPSTGHLEWSEQTYLMFGIPPGTPINVETFFSCVHPDDRATVQTAWQKALESGSTYEVEHRILVNGQIRWMRERAETSRIEHGKIVGTVLDITALKSVQLDLQHERDLFNIGPVLLIEWDVAPGWPIRHISSNVSSILGYSPSELTHPDFRFASLLHPEDLPRIESEVNSYLQAQTSHYEQHYRLRTRSGEYRWFQDFTHVIFDKNQSPSAFIGYLLDITQRKLDEDTLRLHEERFRKLFELAPIGIAINNLETGRFLAVNNALLTATGYSHDEFLQLSYWDITPPQFAPADNAALLSLDQTGRCGPFEKAYYHKNGSLVPIRIQAFSHSTPSGERIAYSFIEDISEKRRTEEQMRLLSSAVQQSSTPILITNTSAEIIYANPALCSLTGYSLEELLGKKPNLFRSPKTPKETYVNLWQTILAGKPWHGELINRRKDGSLYWESINIYPISDPSNKITHFVAIKEDITERKRSEAQLLAHNLELEAALATSQNPPPPSTNPPNTTSNN